MVFYSSISPKSYDIFLSPVQLATLHKFDTFKFDTGKIYINMIL